MRSETGGSMRSMELKRLASERMLLRARMAGGVLSCVGGVLPRVWVIVTRGVCGAAGFRAACERCGSTLGRARCGVKANAVVIASPAQFVRL